MHLVMYLKDNQARAGVLDGKPAATNHTAFGWVSSFGPRVPMIGKRVFQFLMTRARSNPM